MLRKSLIQFSVDGQGCVPSQLLGLRPPPETAGHSQTSLTQSLVGTLVLSPGSWCVQGLFEPSKRPWKEQGLILNENLPLLPSCWGFSFALGRGVSFFGGIQNSPVGVQQRVVILEFSQEMASARPSTLPS